MPQPRHLQPCVPGVLQGLLAPVPRSIGGAPSPGAVQEPPQKPQTTGSEGWGHQATGSLPSPAGALGQRGLRAALLLPGACPSLPLPASAPSVCSCVGSAAPWIRTGTDAPLAPGPPAASLPGEKGQQDGLGPGASSSSLDSMWESLPPREAGEGRDRKESLEDHGPSPGRRCDLLRTSTVLTILPGERPGGVKGRVSSVRQHCPPLCGACPGPAESSCPGPHPKTPSFLRRHLEILYGAGETGRPHALVPQPGKRLPVEGCAGLVPR